MGKMFKRMAGNDQTDRQVLTIATGKKLYIDMAVNLARSFWLWNAGSNIDFYLATDLPQQLPDDVKKIIKIIKLKEGEFGMGFSPKLYLDKLAPQGQTLFIDSDCLIYGKLDFVFEKFKGHAVSVIGGYISGGEWFGDVESICKKFNLPHIPKFNGGVYYLENSKAAADVYETARSLEKKYDETGFVRLRNRPNDEVIMALAIELHQQAPIADNGNIMAEFVNFKSGIKSDLLNGIAELYNDPGNASYQKNWHLTFARPVIVHFLGHHNQVMPYIKEVKQLNYLFVNNWPKNVARLIAYLRVALPFETAFYLKKIFRPLYHRLFRTRKVKISERVIVDD